MTRPDAHDAHDTPDAPGQNGAHVTPAAVLRSLAGFAAAAAVVVLLVPRAARTSWGEIGSALAQVHPLVAVGLLGVTLVALWGYTFVLTGAIRGLTHLQGLLVNVIGSAASNLLPGGGAVGSAVSFAVYRSWGFDATAVSTSLVVTGVWNVAARMLLPLIGVGALLLTGERLPDGVAGGAAVGALTAAALVVCFAAVVASDAAAARVGRALARLLGPPLARLGRRPDVEGFVRGLRATCADVARTRWRPMTFGIVAFLGLQCVLFGLCLHATGGSPSLAHVVAAYAVGRLLSAVGITPGGLGVAEAGTTAALVALGEPHAASAAGVLLFTCYSHLAELPLGALGAVAWRLGVGAPRGARSHDDARPRTPADDASRPAGAGRDA